MLRRLLSITISITALCTIGIIHAESDKTVEKISITGNTLVPDHTVRTKIPYRIGSTFDPRAAKQAIHSLYELGFFQNVRIRQKEIDPSHVHIIVELEEKDRIEHIDFHGNKHLTDEKLAERIDAENLQTIDPEEVGQLERKIQSAYQEKNYHHAEVTTEIEHTDNNRVNIHFYIDEGSRSVVKRVRFVGNEHISSKELRTKIFTREEWILSFLDHAGTYHPDAIEGDKQLIENIYQSNGFLAARVTDAHVEELEDGNFMVTFTIDEGDIYTISDVHIEGNEILSEEMLLNQISLTPGQLYSKDAIRNAMDRLRSIWGEYGYVYADVQPSLRPDENEKTVDVKFFSQLGNRMFADRINIVGNYKTSEKVIRRQLDIDEGDMITQSKLDSSKYRVQSLGYFASQSGVNWRFKKKDDEHADVDLVLHEVKTGRVYFQAGLNANGAKSPLDGASVSGGIRDVNLFGAGIQYNVSGSYSRNDRTVDLSLTDNWLFDRPISSTFHVFSRKSIYEEFTSTTTQPEERISGGMLSFGARPRALGYTQVSGALGLDDIRYTREIQVRPDIIAQFDEQILRDAFVEKVERSFQQGTINWIAGSVSQNQLNHPYFPSRGYAWYFDTKLALPTSSEFSFFQMGLTGHWYTPLIGEHTLVLHGHGYVGASTEQAGRTVPYRELFHIGGDATVRGYEFGQIGPQLFNDSLGGKKALLTNIELLFPITGDGSLRGVIFYDGGASWDTPRINSPKNHTYDTHATSLDKFIENDAFEYRHSIGFGFRASSPAPLRVDWGFKLDRKKARNESLSKVHITMTQDF